MKKQTVKSHRLYRKWTHIQQCFNNPNYRDYAYVKQLGLTCDWTDFWSFVNDIEQHLGDPPSAKHKLNRIDQTKGWTLNNLQWACQREIVRYQRHTAKIRFRNETRPLCEWADILGLSYWITRRRYLKGMTPRQIFAR